MCDGRERDDMCFVRGRGGLSADSEAISKYYCYTQTTTKSYGILSLVTDRSEKLLADVKKDHILEMAKLCLYNTINKWRGEGRRNLREWRNGIIC